MLFGFRNSVRVNKNKAKLIFFEKNVLKIKICFLICESSPGSGQKLTSDSESAQNSESKGICPHREPLGSVNSALYIRGEFDHFNTNAFYMECTQCRSTGLPLIVPMRIG